MCIAFHRRLNLVYALKTLQKARVVAMQQEVNIMNERDLLFRLDHPFIIKLLDTFTDRDW